VKTECLDEFTVDLAVVGAGACGLAAALTAAEGGARVAVAEKQSHFGGSANFAEGLFGVESDLQRREYVGITCDEAFRMIMDYNHWRANPRLVRAIVDESADTIGWLQRQGVKFLGPKAMWPDAPRVWHVLDGPHRAKGAAMNRRLADEATMKGVIIRLATPVTRLLKEGRSVVGVAAEKDGKTVKIASKAVIIATGGYANNKEWIKEYAGFDLGVDLFPLGNFDKRGDGIRMAWEAGAAEEGMGVLQLGRGGPVLTSVETTGLLEIACNQPNIRINQDGQRYCDESIQPNFTFDGNALVRQRGRRAYTLFDEAAKVGWAEQGVDSGAGFRLLPGTRIDIEDDLKKALDVGNNDVFVADSLEELATKIGVDPAVLASTVEEYNRFCDKGHDDLFAKNPRYLRPLHGPRFYALRAYVLFIGTLGGIKINHRMEVLDPDAEPIPGLYAGGLDAGGMYGDSYDLYAAGGTLAFAINSGRIAARNALRYIGTKTEA
jgi:fumarate reductase flavoprotein subunit